MWRKSPDLPRDWVSAWLVMAVSAAMGFLASLGLAAAGGADSLARSWTTDLSARATVSLTLRADAPPNELAVALELIRATPGVASADLLSEADMRALLAPWLGEGPDLALLPLPVLIDVALQEGGPDPLASLARRLSGAGYDAQIDGHGEWVERLRPAANAMRSLAYGGLAIVAAAAALTVAIACSAALAAQARMVELLKLVGAEDGYVSGMFVRRFRNLSFVGSAAGAAGAAATLALAAQLGAGPSPSAPELAPLLPPVALTQDMALRLAATPIAFAIIASLAARVAVTAALKRRST